MIKCICIDDTNRPEEIPPHKWPIKDNQYHITWVYFHPMQGISGVTLKELSITLEDNYPYDTYRLSRFSFTKEDILKLIELAHICSGMDKVDIQKIVEETGVEVIEK